MFIDNFSQWELVAFFVFRGVGVFLFSMTNNSNYLFYFGDYRIIICFWLCISIIEGTLSDINSHNSSIEIIARIHYVLSK
jgi:hypothetical protein